MTDKIRIEKIRIEFMPTQYERIANALLTKNHKQ